MKKNRKYWKETAKSVLRGNWGIAIAGMLAYMAVDFLGTIVSAELFREKLSGSYTGTSFCICCFSDRYGVQHRVQLYDAEYGAEEENSVLETFCICPQPAGPCADRSLCDGTSEYSFSASVLFCYVSGNSRKYNRRTAFVDGTDFWSYAFEYSTECTYHGTICT